MRINDIILESQVQDEGIGSAIGSVAGGLARGVGAVAGGVHGAVDAFGQGYSAGRKGVSGVDSNKQKANQLRQQADKLDGGHTAQAMPAGTSGVAGTAPASGSTVGSTQQPTTQSAATTAQAEPVDTKGLQTSIQHLKGADVERVRGMLSHRAGLSESQLDELNLGALAANARAGAQNIAKGVQSTAQNAVKGATNFVKGAKLGYNNPQAAANLSKNKNTGTMTKLGRLAGRAGTAAVQGTQQAYQAAKPLAQKAVTATGQAIKAAPGALAGAAGSVAATGTQMKQAYQTARGGTMTTQDLERAIASMDPATAKEMLNFLNTIHPVAGGTSPAGAPANTSVPAGTGDEEENPNIVRGYNESVGYSRFLGMEL